MIVFGIVGASFTHQYIDTGHNHSDNGHEEAHDDDHDHDKKH